MLDRLNIVLIATVSVFWGLAAWLWYYRNHPDKLNKVIPIISKYRKGRLHPLFANRKDVLGLAGWFFGIGKLILGLLSLHMR
jgi:hypothetical protein